MRKLNPPQEYLTNLMKLYQNKQYNEAEKLALLITQKFPKNQFGWKALGSVFEKQGRKLDSLKARQKVIVLSPQDPESYYNLGVTLQELDKLDEAKFPWFNLLKTITAYLCLCFCLLATMSIIPSIVPIITSTLGVTKTTFELGMLIIGISSII